MWSKIEKFFSSCSWVLKVYDTPTIFAAYTIFCFVLLLFGEVKGWFFFFYSKNKLHVIRSEDRIDKLQSKKIDSSKPLLQSKGSLSSWREWPAARSQWRCSGYVKEGEDVCLSVLYGQWLVAEKSLPWEKVFAFSKVLEGTPEAINYCFGYIIPSVTNYSSTVEKQEPLSKPWRLCPRVCLWFLSIQTFLQHYIFSDIHFKHALKS